jgi:diadenosine tetraphosphate (Ap4A) HIT family hydrolase
VITRRVVPDWWSATPEERLDLLELIDVVKQRITTMYGPDGFNVGFNSGEAAGQTVPHLHIHVIPRYSGDVPNPRGGIRNVIPDKGNYLAPPEATTDQGTANDVELFDGVDQPLEAGLERLRTPRPRGIPRSVSTAGVRRRRNAERSPWSRCSPWFRYTRV